MSGLDLLSDMFPHGTKEGHEQGCKGGWCPSKKAGGDSCAQAAIRYAGDWEYRKAIDAGEVPPPMVNDRPRGSRLNMASRLVVGATVTVASLDRVHAGPPRALSEEQVAEVVRKRAEGAKILALAGEYGVHPNTIKRSIKMTLRGEAA